MRLGEVIGGLGEGNVAGTELLLKGNDIGGAWGLRKEGEERERTELALELFDLGLGLVQRLALQGDLGERGGLPSLNTLPGLANVDQVLVLDGELGLERLVLGLELVDLAAGG